MLDKGASVGEITGRSEDFRSTDRKVEGTLALLDNLGAVLSEPGLGIDPEDRPERAELLDPWEYQFSRPVLDTPWFVLWEITGACPAGWHCKFCYRSDTDSAGPNPEETDRIIEQLVSADVPFVTLLGGEPLCHDGLYDIIRRLRSNRVYVKIVSNGALLDDEAARRLEDAGLNQVALSIDGLTREVNDATRGEGSFDTVLSAIRALSGRRVRTSISLLVSKETLRQFDLLPEFHRRTGVSEIYLSPCRITSNIPDTFSAEPLDPVETRELTERVASLNKNDLKVVFLRECSCGRSSVVIHPDGSVSPCPFAKGSNGNIYTNDFVDIWSDITGMDAAGRGVRAGSYCFRNFEKI